MPRFKDIEDLGALQAAVQSYLPVMRPHDVCGALSKLAKLEAPSGRGGELSSLESLEAWQFQQQELAARLTDALCRTWQQDGREGAMVDDVEPWQLANVLWAWAKLQHWPQQHFMRLMGRFVHGAGDLGTSPSQALSNATWALGTSWREWQQGQPQGWHPGKVEVEDLMGRLLASCLPLISTMEVQHLSMSLLAATYVEVQLPAGYVERAVQHLRELMPGLRSSQELSNSLWALATLQCKGCEGLLKEAATLVVRGGMRDKPQGWSNLLWAYAKFEHYDPLLCDHMAYMVVQRGIMRGATSQGWSNLLWAYAMLRHYDEWLFQLGVDQCRALLRHTSPQRMSFKPQEMSNMLLACATVYHVPGVTELLDTMLPHIQAKLGHFKEQELCNACWSLAVLGEQGVHPAMGVLMREACGCPSLSPEELCQLWQAHLELQDQGLGSMGLQGQLLEAAQQAWAARAATYNCGLADMQLQVEEVLQRLATKYNFKVEREGTTPDGMFNVDVLVSMMRGAHGQELLVAVEVDGPSHFMANLSTHYDGGTRLRNRQLGRLAKRGLAGLVLVGYHEWVFKSDREQEELLRGKLREVVQGQGGGRSIPPVVVLRGEGAALGWRGRLGPGDSRMP